MLPGPDRSRGALRPVCRFGYETPGAPSIAKGSTKTGRPVPEHRSSHHLRETPCQLRATPCPLDCAAGRKGPTQREARQQPPIPASALDILLPPRFYTEIKTDRGDWNG